MASLKELRTRIEAIKSTQKITSAMKMVAASRLRRVQILVDKNQEYADNLRFSALRVVQALQNEEAEKHTHLEQPALILSKDNPLKYLLYVISSDRGLCGSYNNNVAQKALERIRELQALNKQIEIVCFGKKAYDIIRRTIKNINIREITLITKDTPYALASENIAKHILKQFKNGSFDVCEFVYSDFITTLSRGYVCQQVCPLDLHHAIGYNKDTCDIVTDQVNGAYYDFLPDKITLLKKILPIIFFDNIFQIVVNAAAAEHSARMTSMDNATHNASDMINNLTLQYNSLRQNAITTELIEIIAGAEAI